MNGDLAAVARSIDRIEDQVQEDLHQLIAHAVERRQFLGNVPLQHTALGALVVLGDVQSLSNDFMESDARAFAAGRAAEVDQFAKRGLDALELAADQAQFFARVSAAITALEHLYERAD